MHSAVNRITNRLQRLVGMMSHVWPTTCDRLSVSSMPAIFIHIQISAIHT